MDNWYYRVENSGDEVGPVTLDELIELAKRHSIGSEHEVRFGTNGTWRRAGSMGKLMAHMPSGSHLTPVASMSLASGSNSLSNAHSSEFDIEISSESVSTETKDTWYYKVQDDEFGPVTLDQLIELAKDHSLSSDDQVRFGDMGTWRRAGSMGKLMAHMPSGAFFPPLPREAPVLASSSGADSLPELPDSLSEIFHNRNDLGEAAVEEKVGWYYKVFGDEFGPLPIEEMIELAKNHSLTCDDEVRFGANGVWRRAGSIGQLMAHLPFQSAKPITFDRAKSRAAKDRSAAADRLSDTDISSTDANDNLPVADIVWWCIIQSKEYGPVDLTKLMKWVARGRIRREDYIRCGQDPYVLAGDLPGLFPDLPTAVLPAPATTSDTKAEMSSISETKVMTAASSTTDKSRSSEFSAMSNSGANHSSMAGNGSSSVASPRPMYTPPPGGYKPPTPARRPPAKSSSSSGSFDPGKLLIPGLGVAGVLLLGGLIYFVLPGMMYNKAADVKRFNDLRLAYNNVINVRRTPGAKKESFKPVTDKLTSVAKPVEDELKKGTSDIQKSLASLARILQKIAKEGDLTKPSTSEKPAEKLIEDLKKLLGVS